MNLDIRFEIAGIILILCLIPLYIYRKEIYAKFIKKEDISSFIKEVTVFLKYSYPKIPFNFDINRFNDEENLKRKEILIVEDFVNQFTYHEYEINTQKSVSRDMLWKTYDSNSKLQKDNKYPSDWSQRKEAAWARDNGVCDRCGTKVALSDAKPLLAKQMKNGGGFNLENIAIFCSDCSRVIRSSNLESTKKDLQILDRLMQKVKN